MNLLNFLACKWHATYHWDAFDKGYNFASNLISIEGLHIKLWGPKFARVPTLGISRLPLGSPGTKWHLDVGLVERHMVYYKGENCGFPQVRAVVNLVNLSFPMARLSTKKYFNYALTNLLFGLRIFAWVIKCLSFFLIPSWSSSMPLYPSKV
jgi:hypothetical protein